MTAPGTPAAPRTPGSRLLDAGLALMLAAIPVSVSGAQLGLGLAIFGGGLVAFRRRRLPRTPLDAPVLALLAVTILSAAVSSDPAASLRKVGSAWQVLAMYLLVLRFRSPGELAPFLRFAIPTAVLGGLFGIVQHYTGWLAPGGANGSLHSLGHDGRILWFPEGGFSHYQTFANVYFMLACLMAGMAVAATSRRERLLTAAAAAIAAGAVLFSFTRGVWVALGVALLLFVQAFARRALPALAAGLALAILAALIVPSGVRTRLLSMADAGTNVERLLLWETSWSMLRDHPVLGVGVGRYAVAQDEYVREEVPMLMTRTHAHNIWLQAAVERGVLGLAAFAWLVAAAIRQAFGTARRVRDGGGAAAGLAVGAATALAGFLVDGLVQNNFGDAQVSLLFWLVVGTAVICSGTADSPLPEAVA